jgi:lipoyl-dependent peroxiredoxin
VRGLPAAASSPVTTLEAGKQRTEHTMSNEIKVLYTAEATATGGREGHSRTSDGRVDVDLDVPTELGGSGGPGTNPEQLFAGGLGLTAALDLDAPRIARAEAVDLMKRAHETCPYSRATRGNIDVSLTVSGASIERQAA